MANVPGCDPQRGCRNKPPLSVRSPLHFGLRAWSLFLKRIKKVDEVVVAQAQFSPVKDHHLPSEQSITHGGPYSQSTFGERSAPKALDAVIDAYHRGALNLMFSLGRAQTEDFKHQT